MKQNVTALVLSGGIGKRFWPLTFHKSMVPFLGKSLLEHNLEMIKKMGITQCIVVLPNGESFSPQMNGMDIKIVKQSDAKGMGDAVLAARNFIGTSPCFVMNGEDVVEDELARDMQNALERDEAFVVGKKVTDYFDGGYLKLSGDRLVEIIEKPGKGNEPSDLINLVFHYFPNPSLFFDALKKTTSDRDDVYERALSAVATQIEMKVIPYEGFWQPVKYPWHVLNIMEYFLNNTCTDFRGKNVEIKSHVVIEGPVYIEDNVSIFENTKIVGPCYIGKDTIIGNNNIIRHSQIGAGCVTGFNTDITRSYVGDTCWFHSNYVGDSVLEGNVSLGSGTVLANLRLDEGNIWSEVAGKRMNTGRNKLGALIGSDVRIGVNTSVMPGVKIGNHSFICAGIVLDKDVPDNSFCLAESKYSIKPNTHGQLRNRDEFKAKL